MNSEASENVPLAFFRTAIGASGLGVWKWNPQASGFAGCENLAALFGLASVGSGGRLELIPSIHPEDQPQVEPALQRALVEHSACRLEFRVVLPGGSMRWLLMYGGPASDSDGARLGLCGVAQDITERKLSERMSRESEERFRNLFESMSLGVVYQDSKGRIFLANPAAERILGLTLAQMQGRISTDPCWRAVHEDGSDFPGESHPAMVALRSGQAVRDVVMGISAPGTNGWVWININATPQFRPHETAPFQVYTTFEDISHRKQSEEALRANERRLLALAAISADVLYRMSPDWTRMLQLTSKRFLAETSISSDAWLSRYIHPDDQPRVLSAITQAINTKDAFELEHRVLRADGSFGWTLSRAVPVLDQVGCITEWFGSAIDVTQRKQDEEDRAILMRQRKLALDAAHLGWWRAHLETRTGAWDERFQQLFDLPAKDGPMEEVLDRIHPEDRPKVLSAVQAALNPAEPKPYSQEYRLIRSDGTVCFVRAQGVVEFEGTGQTRQAVDFVGTVEDITERKQMEERLRESERRHTLLFEKSATPTVLLKLPEVVIVDANEACEEMTGFTRDEMRGKTAAELGLIDEDSRQKAIYRFRRDGTVASMEVRLVTKNGAERFVVSKTNALQVGGQAFAITTLQDITARRQAEADLREREQQLRVFVEHAPAAVAMMDTKMRYLVVSQRWLSDYHLGQRNIIGLSHYDVFPEIGERWKQVHRRCLAGAVERSDLDSFPRVDGSTDWVRWEIRPWRDAGGEIGGLVLFSELMTKQVVLEEQLRQSQKLEAIGQLAGGVAHDFNNILASIMMQRSLMQMNPALDGATRAGLDEIGQEAQRAASLTRQLLLFSRRAVLSVRPLDLNEVVGGLMKMLCRLIGENINLEVLSGGSLPLVEADAGLLEQVIVNLVVNARDAMPRGGRITITTTVAEASETQAAGASDHRAGRHAILAVSDTGCGMDAETLSRAFEPFFTTKEAGKGTGLGLATVHGIVAQHKGRVQVESRLGTGTTFRIFLPALHGTHSEPSESPNRPQGACGKETVLVVEDQPTVRQLLAHTLRAHGYVVLEAENGNAAVSLWRDHRTDVDLLFTDMVMPEGMTGLELAERLRQSKPGLKVIISSGYHAEFVQQSSVGEAGIVYLPKPYEGHTLTTAVRTCLDQGSVKPTAPEPDK